MESLNAHYRLLLGLNDDWAVGDVDLCVPDKRVSIALAFVGDRVTCPDCGAECSLHDHAPQRRWRHLDTMQFETILTTCVPRSACESCGVKTTAVPWAGKHSRFTLMFEAFAIDVLIAAGSVQSGRALIGLSWQSAHAVMQRAVQRGLAKRDNDGLRYVGIDEKSFGHGQSYVSVMTDQQGSRVLEVVPDRTEEAADTLWNMLTKEQCESIEAVSIDMWQAYENSVETNAPQAEIVFDKFHIAKHLNEAVDKVRRAEHNELKAEGDRSLTGLRQLLLYHPENLTEERSERLSDFLGDRKRQQLRTARAWGLKDYFRWFWMYPDAASAEEFFEEWYAWAIRSRLQPVKKVARMLKRRLKNILSWFRHPISNATAEGFNSRIQSIKSNARGFRNFANYRTRILFFCGKLKLKPC